MLYRVKGFTIVELLVVLTIIALLLTIITPNYINNVDDAKEMALKQNLTTLRYSIDKFYSDNGHYPEKLNDLVERRYLRQIPIDPTNQKQEWRIIKDQFSGAGIYDIKSINNNMGSDERRYSEW
ncbi:type II secretion system protein G [Acinetobacter sp. Root1280]|uniref:type II secretion system protein n=1 Tax=Acinetobacter sp. Root1280 TaxID=1736444 RepID=UPI0006FF876A|nr:prepilin-type N-terminal cleavage/methylation domain-containing protein [Acinetobacter sp. Root1280]KQW99770.1 type II secretion system protein G [Acinetobacter sp. Root1280]